MDTHKFLTTKPKVDEAIEEAILLRDALDSERKKWQQIERAMKEDLERIAMYVKRKADEMGLDSVKTAHGTAYRVTKETFSVGNWDELSRYILDTGNIQLVEKRVSKTAAREIMAETNNLPPGVVYFAEEEFQFRRPSRSK